MHVKLSNVLVDDQDKALDFYTRALGFVVRHDVPMGEHRWLTVTSPEGHDDVELLLEPMAFPPAHDWQRSLFEAGIPAAAFFSKDIDAEHARLVKLGVVFRSAPTAQGPVKTAVFEDTCGNLINLVQVI